MQADLAAEVGESPMLERQNGHGADQSGASSITQEQVLMCRVRQRNQNDPTVLIVGAEVYRCMALSYRTNTARHLEQVV